MWSIGLISDDEIDRALRYLRDNAEKDAQARAERLYLEEWKDVVLAQQQALHADMSVAAARVQAESSEAYKAALEAYKQAIFEDERRRFLRAAAETRIEAWRTQSSNLRAEGKAY